MEILKYEGKCISFVYRNYEWKRIVIRIIIDGYSLLNNWREICERRPWYSVQARDRLIRRVQGYADVVRVPVTVVFDGIGRGASNEWHDKSGAIEVLYSGAGETADDIIERVVFKLLEYGEILAVTDDLAERRTIAVMGGTVWSCLEFIEDVKLMENKMKDELKHSSSKAKKGFESGIDW
ncbi:MAG: NYN domain-containing protein [Verrucomicrobia bacterium]|nr:NYN domain-containing protein [Verrucomicrobiota bacterium]